LKEKVIGVLCGRGEVVEDEGATILLDYQLGILPLGKEGDKNHIMEWRLNIPV